MKGLTRGIVLVALLVVTAAAPARAADPPFVPWSSLLPGLTNEYNPTSENNCVAGRVTCVDAVIREMYRRFNPLARRCDHDAIFSLAYLRTTEEYRRAVGETPPFFSDNAFVNHQDAVFAQYYFDAFDAWHGGRRSAVPKAWAIAFRAADDRAVAGSGNLLLGMNAHIQRDLPLALYAIGGLTKRDGSSRKRDHERVNIILDRVYPSLLAELVRRFDPTIDDANLPTTLDDFGIFQVIPAWRETAWRNAERLALAPTAAARATVRASFEAYAASQAEEIRTGTAYNRLLGQSSRQRDAYCATHWAG